MKRLDIDRTKPLRDQPHTGHNRWHADIPPILEVDPGEEVAIQTRDALDGQLDPLTTAADLVTLRRNVAHPLTGPIAVKGAQPGDLLEVECLDIVPKSYGWTRTGPGMGFLPDLLTESILVHWDLRNSWATSSQLQGLRLREASFMGTAGVAPSRELMASWAAREDALQERGGIVFPRTPVDAVPSAEPIASEGFRTIPPRENGGNLDVKQLTRGSRLFLPVHAAGALYSVGDGHYAQGDGECCLTAIEMAATQVVRFTVHSGEAVRRGIRWPRFAHPGYFTAPEWAVPRNFIATTGMPVDEDGRNDGGNLTLAARNALLNMIDLLAERGWTKAQAYVICSVAVDLKISNAVDLPNVTVSAFLPEDIFHT